MPTSCRRMFALKRSSTPQSRHSRRDAAVDRQSMELPITLPADHPLRLGNFTSAHLGTFESALTLNRSSRAYSRVAQVLFVRRYWGGERSAKRHGDAPRRSHGLTLAQPDRRRGRGDGSGNRAQAPAAPLKAKGLFEYLFKNYSIRSPGVFKTEAK